MTRNRATGEKTTRTKPERRHGRAVDTAIRKQTPDTVDRGAVRRMDKTFTHLHKTNQRYRNRRGL